MRRREFITLIGSAAAAWPLDARAQQSAMPVIGFLGSESPDLWVDRLRNFRKGLGESGYVEGKNVTIEYRWAEGHNDRLPRLAAELADRKVNVIAALSTPPVPVAKAATSTIPIVFVTAGDPAEAGLVASLNHPGGNLTGVTGMGLMLGAKRLDLLHELLPAARVVALLVNSKNANSQSQSRDLQTAAGTLGLTLHVLQAASEGEIEDAFSTARQSGVGGLVIEGDPYFTSRSDMLATLALYSAMPTIYQFRAFAAAGGLISYGSDIADSYRLAGIYTGRILKGEKPADLPVQQATKIELIINLKTAKTLGVSIPITLLGRADEVIE
jgi:putative tryptophan/tyrosine transport system substrate-binding protein